MCARPDVNKINRLFQLSKRCIYAPICEDAKIASSQNQKGNAHSVRIKIWSDSQPFFKPVTERRYPNCTIQVFKTDRRSGTIYIEKILPIRAIDAIAYACCDERKRVLHDST